MSAAGSPLVVNRVHRDAAVSEASRRDATTPGARVAHFDFVKGADNRRLMTALIYLNDDYEGGETEFVRTGLKIKGKTGDVILFRNDGDDTGPNPNSEHAGLPVTKGAKYLATRWIREERWIP